MFSNLREKLSASLRKLTGRDKLTENNIREALTEVRSALLDADVPLQVADPLLTRIERQAIGQQLVSGIQASQQFIKVVYDELVAILGGGDTQQLQLKVQPPAVILMAGLQGAGKTTSVAKLALLLGDANGITDLNGHNGQRKRIMTVSCDLYRPAAREQLQILAEQHHFIYYDPVSSDDSSNSSETSDLARDPVAIARTAYAEAKRQLMDILIVDTAGRLHVQQELMNELKAIADAVHPVETLLVVDSMTGRDSLTIAQEFQKTVPLTGVILTKTDSDTRGGAALAMRCVTGCPIKFVGVGEKIEDGLELFHPERIASSILGMGDVLSLVEQAYKKIDKKQADDLTKKVYATGRMDLEDMRHFLLQMRKLGNMSSILSKLPANLFGGLKLNQNQLSDGDQKIDRMLVVINSMTKKERRFPANIRPSHKQRIAKGSGTSIAAVNEILRTYEQMRKQFAKIGGGGKLAGLLNKFLKF